MHISEGILSGPVLAAGVAMAAAGVGVGFKRMDFEKIPQSAILSAAFFVASLIHVPIGPSSVHLILNGIVGLMLGWGAFPAIFVALLLQGMIFQFGGLTTLGVNTVIMALPAVVSYLLFARVAVGESKAALPFAFACGFSSVLFSALVMSASLIFTEENFLEVAGMVVVAHLPVMVIEGVVTAFCVGFLKKVQPSLISGDRR